MTFNSLTSQGYFILLLGTLLSNELIIRMPLGKNYAAFIKLVGKIFRILRSPRISDHWKEQVVVHYAANLLAYVFMFLVLLVLALFPLSLCLWLVSASFEQMLILSTNPILISIITIISILFILFRLRHNA